MLVVTYGEALVDLIEQQDGSFTAILGGSVANFTLAVARQGMAATYLNPLSTDSFGGRFARHLGAAGITLASARLSALPTALAVVTLDASKVPSYAFHRAGVADRDITLEQACASLPPGPTLLHTGGLALVPDDIGTTLAVAAAAAGKGALVSIDANLRPLAVPDLGPYAAGVRQALALAHLVKVSEEDLLYLGMDSADPVAAARTLFDGTATQLIALTLGAGGGVLLSRDVTVALPVPADVHVVDTVGAGDCFQAGLVASLHAMHVLALDALPGLDAPRLERALRYAIATASIDVMRAGCNPPLRAEVEQFLTTHGDLI
jgi:fructokinase